MKPNINDFILTLTPKIMLKHTAKTIAVFLFATAALTFAGCATTSVPVSDSMPQEDAMTPPPAMENNEGAMEEDKGMMEEDKGMMEDEGAMAEVTTFKLTGMNYKFISETGKEAPTLRVKAGQKVRIDFTSTEGFHDWVVDEFNARTEQVSAGNSTSVEFTPDKPGTYEYYCSVGNHRAQGMVGKLIVE